MNRFALHRTDDGSWTLVSSDGQLSYRSTRGAHTESQHVFIKGSCILNRPSPWRVLEYGFGLGTNLDALLCAAEHADIEQVYYVGLEKRPISTELLPTPTGGHRSEIEALLNTKQCKGNGFEGRLMVQDFTDFSETSTFDAIFFDPFGPSDSPECWTAEVMRHAFKRLAPDGVLSTYAAAGWVRRNMARAGFYVATTSGAQGKRDMTVAAKSAEALSPLKIRNRPTEFGR